MQTEPPTPLPNATTPAGKPAPGRERMDSVPPTTMRVTKRNGSNEVVAWMLPELAR